MEGGGLERWHRTGFLALRVDERSVFGDSSLNV